MILETLLPQLEFQSNIEDAVKQKMNKSRRQVEEIAATAYSSNDFDFLLCKRMPLTRLVVVVYLLTQKYAEYKAVGVTDEIILDTFSDVSLRANLYYKQHGRIGISKDDVVWFRHIMNVHIFKIGVLQYQTFNMVYLDEETIGEPYMVFTQEQKRTLPNGWRSSWSISAPRLCRSSAVWQRRWSSLPPGRVRSNTVRRLRITLRKKATPISRHWSLSPAR